MRSSKRRGFTLIELMVVVIIVAILAAAAVPIYFRQTNRAKASEGAAGCGSVRTAERVYRTEHSVYLAVKAGSGDIEDELGLDFDDNKYFNEACFSVAASGDTFTVTCDGSLGANTDVADIKIQMDQGGKLRYDFGDGYGDWE